MEDFKQQLLVLKQLFRGLPPADQTQALSMVRETQNDLQGFVRSKLASDAMKTIHSVAENLIQETYGINPDFLTHVCPPDSIAGPSWAGDDSLSSPRYSVPEVGDGGDLLTNALYDTLRRNEIDTGRQSAGVLLSPTAPRPGSTTAVLHDLLPVNPNISECTTNGGSMPTHSGPIEQQPSVFTNIIIPVQLGAELPHNLLDTGDSPIVPNCSNADQLQKEDQRTSNSSSSNDKFLPSEAFQPLCSSSEGTQRPRGNGTQTSHKTAPKPNSVTPKTNPVTESRPTQLFTSLSQSELNLKTYSCPDCPYIAIHRQNLHRHRKNIHSASSESSKLFPCAECGKEYKTKSALNEHHAYVHASPNRNLKCAHCDRTFVQNKDLNRHLKLCHDGSRDHECGICHRSFKLPAHLKRHLLKVHDVAIKT